MGANNHQTMQESQINSVIPGMHSWHVTPNPEINWPGNQLDTLCNIPVTALMPESITPVFDNKRIVIRPAISDCT